MTTILVVDDSDVMRQRLRAALQGDWSVEEAATADEGLMLARKLSPDVILLDFVLPDADGLILMREIRRSGIDSPIIALTGASSTEIAYRFITAGASDFLVKDGLTSGDVRSAVRHALQLRDAGVALRTPIDDEPDTAQQLLDDPPEGDEPPDARPLRILVVDDTSVARAAVRGVLGRAGWTIDEAEDVRGAKAAIGKHAYDAILLDYLLPDHDGVEALGILRDAGLKAPVIALTSHGSDDLAERFVRAGAIDFLGKDDLSEARFVHAIRRAVAAHEAFSRHR